MDICIDRGTKRRTRFRMSPLAPLVLAISLCLFVLCPGSALAIGSVTDGDVTFAYTNDFNTSNGNTVDTDFTGAATGDLTWESWWFFRVSGDGRETAFATPDLETYSGSVGQLDWNDPGGAGLFSAILQFEVLDTGIDMGNLFQNMLITNTGGANLTIDIFHYSDLDLAGTFGGDSAILAANPDGIEINVSDGADSAPIIGYGADAYQVTPWRTLLRDLTDNNVDDFDNSGLPFGPDDFTGGFQWSTTIAAGSTESFLTQFGSNAPLLPRGASIIPEPNTALLAGLGLLLLGARRPKD